MTTDYRDLITRMAKELDNYRQLLLDDRTVTHRLSDEARAALADEPAVPDGREPVAVTGQPSDEELARLWFETDGREVLGAKEIGKRAKYARAVLARWGNPAPPPPADGEVEELVALLRAEAKDDMLILTPADLLRAADLLQHLSPPQPVPVSERLPGPKDCDAAGRCWWHRYTPTPEWHLRFGRTGQHNHWLPAHALPLPEVGE